MKLLQIILELLKISNNNINIQENKNITSSENNSNFIISNESNVTYQSNGSNSTIQENIKIYWEYKNSLSPSSNIKWIYDDDNLNIKDKKIK